MICNIDDVEINYEVFGSGVNVLLIHGFAVDHHLMKGCMQDLLPVNKFKSIYIDLPGMGKSNSPESINSSDDILNVLLKFINKVIPNEKFIIIGESYGGYISRGIHYKLKEQIKGLGLICPVIVAKHSNRTLPDHIIKIKDEAFLNTLDKVQKENFSKFNVVLTKYVYERYQKEIMHGISLSNKSFLNKIQNLYEFSFDVDSHEYKIDIPTLILTGKQDSIVGYEDAYNILKNYRNGTYLVLDSAGHNLQIEQHEIFNSIMDSWLGNF